LKSFDCGVNPSFGCLQFNASKIYHLFTNKFAVASQPLNSLKS